MVQLRGLSARIVSSGYESAKLRNPSFSEEVVNPAPAGSLSKSACFTCFPCLKVAKQCYAIPPFCPGQVHDVACATSCIIHKPCHLFLKQLKWSQVEPATSSCSLQRVVFTRCSLDKLNWANSQRHSKVTFTELDCPRCAGKCPSHCLSDLLAHLLAHLLAPLLVESIDCLLHGGTLKGTVWSSDAFLASWKWFARNRDSPFSDC